MAQSHHIARAESLVAENDTAARALELRKAVTAAHEGVRRARDIGNESLARWRAAKAELESVAISNSADLDAQQALADKVTSLEKLADHGIVTGRIRAADKQLTEAQNAFSGFCRQSGTLDGLIGPLESEAVEATEALRDALAILEPIRARYNAIRDRVVDVTAACHPVAAPGKYPDLSRFGIPTEPALPLPEVYLLGETEPEEHEAPTIAGTTPKAEPVLVVGHA